MTRLTLNKWDSNYPLADVLDALKPMLTDYLFLVGDFEPGWWTSKEAWMWVSVVNGIEMQLSGTEPVMLSYRNTHYFATSSLGMGDYDLRIAERPSDLHSNSWIGAFANYGDFEVAFRDGHLVDEAERLLTVAGFESTRSEMPELCKIALPDGRPNKFFRRNIENILSYWDDGGEPGSRYKARDQGGGVT